MKIFHGLSTKTEEFYHYPMQINDGLHYFYYKKNVFKMKRNNMVTRKRAFSPKNSNTDILFLSKY